MFAQDRRLAVVAVATSIGATLASGTRAQPLPPSFGAHLTASKLALLGGGRFSHPFYWAPFVLSGAAARR